MTGIKSESLTTFIGIRRSEGMPDDEWGRVEIYDSVMRDGDFARYIIGTNSGSFEWSSRRLGEPPKPTRQEIVGTFVKSLTKSRQTSEFL